MGEKVGKDSKKHSRGNLFSELPIVRRFQLSAISNKDHRVPCAMFHAVGIRVKGTRKRTKKKKKKMGEKTENR